MGAFHIVCCYVDSFYHNVLCPGDTTISDFFRGHLISAPQLLFGNDLGRRQGDTLHRFDLYIYRCIRSLPSCYAIFNLNLILNMCDCGIMSLLCQVRRIYGVSISVYLSILDTRDDSAWKMTTTRLQFSPFFPSFFSGYEQPELLLF